MQYNVENRDNFKMCYCAFWICNYIQKKKKRKCYYWLDSLDIYRLIFILNDDQDCIDLCLRAATSRLA